MLLLRGKYSFVEELVILSGIKCIVSDSLSRLIVSCVTLVIGVDRFKFFLFVDSVVFVIINQNWVLSFDVIYSTARPPLQIVDFAILEVLAVVYKRLLLTYHSTVCFLMHYIYP